MSLLHASNLRKTYDGRVVVQDVSFHVEPGEIVGLLGRNGAGKTTSFRIVIGMLDADSGSVAFNGRDVSNLPMYQRARLGMSYLSQEESVFQRLTCEQNLLAILETLEARQHKRHSRARRPSLPHATGRMKSLSRQNTGPWRDIRLRGVGPAQPAAALRQRMWRSRTELDRALDPDGF